MGESRQTPRLETVIGQIVDGRLILSHGGGFPAKITAWDSATGRATVEAYFMLLPAGTDDEPDPAPELIEVENVRVLFPSVGGWTMRAQSIVGEKVWCLGSARSLEALDTWQANGVAYVPSPPRVMAQDDLVALPVSWGGGSSSSLVIEGHGASVELTPAGKVLLNGGGDAVARLGDSVNMGVMVFTAPATIAGTYTPPGGAPVAFTVGVPFALSGKINSGSATVEAG